MKKAISCGIVFLITIFSYVAPRAQERADTANITCEQAFELIKAHEGDTNFVIIDFRPKHMFDKAYLENAIYYDYFSDGVDAWLEALDRNKIYLIYCNVGKRTGMALEKMRGMGFKKIYHMYEGIPVWKAKGYKTLSNRLSNED